MKEILKDYIKKLPADEYALFLSGGMDSILILICLLELKKKVHAYSFSRSDRLSSDFKRAQIVANHFHIPFDGILLDMNDQFRLIGMIRKLKYSFKAKKKTDFECAYPFLESAPFIDEKYIITGHAAEGNFCISKKGILHYTQTQELLEQFRDQYYSKPTQYHILEPMFKSYDKELVYYPFAIPELREYFRGKTWNECNKPKQKQQIYKAVVESELWQNPPIELEKHTNLQLGDSSIAEKFNEVLLAGTDFKNTIAIYNRL